MAFLNNCIGVSVPSRTRSNEDISNLFPEWDSASIFNKIGIKNRFICARHENSLSLAVGAYLNLKMKVEDFSFDFLLFVSNSSQMKAPGDGHRFLNEISNSSSVGCLDLNMGCSGYTYALGLAASIIDAGNASNVLVMTTDAYSKFIVEGDKSNMAIFGDGSTASIVSKVPITKASWEIQNFKFGSNGLGYKDLNITQPRSDDSGILFMDGKKIFDFTANEVVNFINDQGIDRNYLYIFHQANAFMLDYMRRKLGISPSNFLISMENRGNTVSSSIPFVLNDFCEMILGQNIFLCGFGIGASYSSIVLKGNDY